MIVHSVVVAADGRERSDRKCMTSQHGTTAIRMTFTDLTRSFSGASLLGMNGGYSNEIIVHLPENVEYVGDEYFYGFTVDDKPVYRIIIWRNPRNSYDVRPQLLADDSCPVLDWKYKE